MFGQATQKPIFGSGSTFGASSSFNTTGSLFGQSALTQPQSSSLFGTPKSATVTFGTQPQSTNLFGSSALQPSTTSAGLLFGASTAVNAGVSSSGLFGATPSNQASTGLFGATANSASKPIGFFGSQPAAAAPSQSLFGSTNVFGMPASAASTTGTTSSGLFGQGSNMFGSTGGMSGSIATVTNTNGTNIPFNPLIGQDTMLRNNIQQNIQTKHQCISAMKEYESKSLEELRVEDYLIGRKGPQPSNSGLFGSSLAGTSAGSGGLFGVGSSQAISPGTGLFQTSQPAPMGGVFSSTAAQPQMGGLFGSSFNKPSTSGLFGSTATTSQSFLFGSQTTPAFQTAPIGSNLFGSSAAPPTGGLFSSQPLQASGSSLFGGVSSFGSAGGLFGNKSSAPAFAPIATAPAFAFSGNAAAPSFASKPAFGSTTTPGFFGSTVGGFGSTMTNSAPAFGTPNAPMFGSTSTPFQSGNSLFGNAQQNKSFFGSNQPVAAGGNLFGNSAPNAFAPSAGGGLFNTQGNFFQSNNASKPGGLFGSATPGSFGTSLGSAGGLFNPAPTVLPQQTQIGTDPATFAAQQSLLQYQVQALSTSPYGESSLFEILPKGGVVGSGLNSDRLSFPRPTDPVAQRSILLNGTKLSSTPTMARTLPFGSSNIVSPIPNRFGQTLIGRRDAAPFNTMSVGRNMSRGTNGLFTDIHNTSLPSSHFETTIKLLPQRNIKKLILNRSDASNANGNTSDIVNVSLLPDKDVPTILPSPEYSLSARRTVNGLHDNFGPAESFPALRSFNQSGSDSFDASIDQFKGKIDYADGDDEAEEQDLSPPAVTTTSSNLAARSQTFVVNDLEKENEDECEVITNHNFPSSTRENVSGNSDDYEEYQEASSGEVQQVTHPCGIVLLRHGYYTIPSLDEMKPDENGSCLVEGFTVGREGYGSVHWPGVIDVCADGGLDLDRIIHFRHKEVIVYPDDDDKPSNGRGLNRHAEITLHNVWPLDKTTHSPIKNGERLDRMRFTDVLKKQAERMGGEFLDFRVETGSWTFSVPHFTKYGYLDNEEDMLGIMEVCSPTEISALQQDEELQRKVQLSKAPKIRKHKKKNIDKVSKTLISPTITDFAVEKIESEDLKFLRPEPVLTLDADSDDFMNADCDLTFSDDRRFNMRQIQNDWLSPDVVKLKSSFFESDYDGPVAMPFFENDQTQFEDSTQENLKNCYERSTKLLKKEQNQSQFVMPHISLTVDKTSSMIEMPCDVSFTDKSTCEQDEMNKQTVMLPMNKLKAVPFAKSVLSKKYDLWLDHGCFQNCRFRIGWSSKRRLIHNGLCLSENLKTDSRGGVFSPIKQPSVDQLQFISHSNLLLEQFSTNDLHLPVDYIETLLKCQLLNSELVVSDKIGDYSTAIGSRFALPYFKTVNGTKLALNYAEFVHDYSANNSSMAVHYSDLLFQLCSALWGQLDNYDVEPSLSIQQTYTYQLARRQAFSDWLQKAVADTLIDGLHSHEIDEGSELAFAKLSCGDVVNAAMACLECNNPRLALLVSQAGSLDIRSLAEEQLSQWVLCEADRFISKSRLKIMILLAGRQTWKNSKNETVNICENIDWKRAFLLLLFYCFDKNIDQTISVFEHAFATPSESSVAPPVPPYLEQSHAGYNLFKSGRFDMCYQLMRLYCDRSSVSLLSVLNNEGYTLHALDYHLSWHLQCILSALGYGESDRLHVRYANQLSQLGLWEWAIFVALHIQNSSDRERLVKDLLSENVELLNSADNRIQCFLLDDLHIPCELIYEVQHVYSSYINHDVASKDC